jgi:ribosomal protein S18 acetylase RimI-like enzyme
MVMIHEHAMHERADFSGDGKLARLTAAIFSSEPTLKCWIIELDDTIAGYCTFTIDFSTWDAAHYVHMDCLFLRSAYRGNGIGRKVVMKLEGYAIANGIGNIQWQTPVFNKEAIGFYNRIGATSKSKIRYTLSVDTLKLS